MRRLIQEARSYLIEEQYDSKPDTLKHIETVRDMIDKLVKLINGLVDDDSITDEFDNRKRTHDQSKLKNPELDTFNEFTEKLKDSTYGSDEYKQFLDDMKPALKHHYENNSHHPEYYSNGVDGMSLYDIAEMWADWKASTLRHEDGDLNKSIDINTKRFKIQSVLSTVLKNSIKLFDVSNTTSIDELTNLSQINLINLFEIYEKMMNTKDTTYIIKQYKLDNQVTNILNNTLEEFSK